MSTLNLEPDSGGRLSPNFPGRAGGLALRELEEIPDGCLSLLLLLRAG